MDAPGKQHGDSAGHPVVAVGGARATDTVTVPVERPSLTRGAEYHLELRVRLVHDTRWADAGHVLAWLQTTMPFDGPAPGSRPVDQLDALTLDASPEWVTVQGDDFSVAVGRASGALESLVYDGNGRGRLVVADSLMSVSAWSYAQSDLAAATHTHELPNWETTTVNLDYGQTGLGGNNSWSKKARPLRRYRLCNSTYIYGITLRPYSDEKETLGARARVPLPRIE